MSQTKLCPECGSDKIYRYQKPVYTGGGYGPDLVPGVSGWGMAKMIPVVCTNCGYIRQFADDATTSKIESSKKWAPMGEE